MGTRNSVSIGRDATGSTVMNAHNLNVRIAAPRRSRVAQSYPVGSIGNNALMRNYVRYLVQRYHRFRQADQSFGRGQRPFSYAVLFKNIESKFKAPTYFILESRFPGLVDYLHERIDGTILGKRNHARGIKNFETWDEYQIGQTEGSETADFVA